MREIKFRAWDNKSKQFVYVALGTPDFAVNIVVGDVVKISKVEGLRFDNELIWQQYTGLKDKNGKEIYEDDLFKTIVSYWQVVFKDGCWMVKDITGYYLDNNNRYKLLKDFVKNKSVIGNIYENRDLLK